jgi:transposase-like protein
VAINRYSPETKAAVMASLLTGQAISEVAEEYKIPEGTVKSWKSRGFEQKDTVAAVATQKKDIIGSLIVEYVMTALQTLRAQAEMFANEQYLKKQPASELAVLHGVLADKTIRILEGIAANAPDDSGGAAAV